MKTEDQDKGHLTTVPDSAPTAREAMRSALSDIDPCSADAYSDEQIDQLVAATLPSPVLTDERIIDLYREAWNDNKPEPYSSNISTAVLRALCRAVEREVIAHRAPTPPASSPVAGEPKPLMYVRLDNVYDVTTHPSGATDPMRMPVYATPVAPSVDAAWVEKAMDLTDKCQMAAIKLDGTRETGDVLIAARSALRAHLSTAIPAQPKE